ncbi:unnamed protein product [Clavelina lepadiformis]|uniref:Uncharacterized protein n=1 Tax=Clavelina lepadiformis TaxID=159417 RepID=A0ABP0GF27_CLALP
MHFLLNADGRPVPSFGTKSYPSSTFYQDDAYTQHLPQGPDPMCLTNILYQSPQQEVTNPHQLPHVPIFEDLEPKNIGSSYENPSFYQTANDKHDKLDVKLNPLQAADVINHFMTLDPTRKDQITSTEAWNVMVKAKNQQHRSDVHAVYNREQSVIIKPHQIADLVNNHRRRAKREEHKKPWCREISPIEEELGVEIGYRLPYEDNSQESLKMENTIGNNTQSSPRNDSKRLSFAQTIDNDEKVSDWLARTPKNKAQKYKRPSSCNESVGTTTHIITRPLPLNMEESRHNCSIYRFSLNKSIVSHGFPKRRADDDIQIPRTIKQSRKISLDKHLLPISENKAKSLVDKLLKAPERSHKSKVGPGLEVTRENAFVDDRKFDSF